MHSGNEHGGNLFFVYSNGAGVVWERFSSRCAGHPFEGECEEPHTLTVRIEQCVLFASCVHMFVCFLFLFVTACSQSGVRTLAADWLKCDYALR